MALKLGKRSKQSTAGRLSSTRADIRRAEGLATDGKILEAIAALVAANRAEPDAAIERRLVDLRFAAFVQGERPSGLASWPPVAPDLFPGVVEPPEVRAEDLTVDVLRSAILRHGSLIVRGFLDSHRAGELVAETDRVFAAHDVWATGTPSSETAPWYEPLDWYSDTDRRWAREGGGVLAVESPRAFFDLIETFEARHVRELVTGYLGEAPALLANKWTLRRVSATANDADWHQDGSFMGKEVRSINLWVTLSDCGVDAPGPRHRLPPTRGDRRHRHRRRPARLDGRTGDGGARCGGHLAAPRLRRGRRDVLRSSLPAPHRDPSRDDQGPVRDRIVVRRSVELPGEAAPHRVFEAVRRRRGRGGRGPRPFGAGGSSGRGACHASLRAPRSCPRAGGSRP